MRLGRIHARGRQDLLVMGVYEALGVWVIREFGFVSNFGIRDSNLKVSSCFAIRSLHRRLTVNIESRTLIN